MGRIMMICPKCGREIPDGTVCPCTHETLTLSSNPAVNVIKTVGSSKLFLAMSILRTVSAVLGLIGAVILFSMGGRAFTTLQGEISGFAAVDPSMLEPSIRIWNALSIVYLVIIAIVIILALIPYWLHYATCRSKKTGNVSTAALTLWKVFTWISIVSLGLMCAFLMLYMILFLILGSALMATSGTTIPEEGYNLVFAVLIVVLIIFGAILGLEIAYLITRLRLLDRAKDIANTGVPNDRVSRFLIVLTWVAGVYSAISALPALVMLPFLGIAGLASAASGILAALCLTRYKKEMTAVMYPPVQPVYAQSALSAAPVAPQQPVSPVTEQTAEQPEAPAESDSEESE